MTRSTTLLIRTARRVADVIAECNYAQRRWTTLMTTPDSYMTHGDEAPDDYSEFLFRTSGALLCEPDADGREHGRVVG